MFRVLFIACVAMVAAEGFSGEGDHKKHHHHHKSHSSKNSSWFDQKQKIKNLEARSETAHSWFKGFLKQHQNKMNELETEISNLSKQKDGLSGMEIKKIELKINRAKTTMTEKQNHFADDFKKMDKLIGDLEKLKEEFDSHEGHEH